MSKKYLITSDDTAELWEGTQAEFTTESADIPNGTLVVINDDLPTGELIDKTLDTTSENAISNKAVATAVNSINQNLAKKTSDDWVYTEFASGLKFCRCTKTVNITSWNAWGSVYETNNLFSRVFPFTFEKTPLIIANIPNNATLGTEINADATKINSLYMTRPNNAGITGNVELNIYVIGF